MHQLHTLSFHSSDGKEYRIWPHSHACFEEKVRGPFRPLIHFPKVILIIWQSGWVVPSLALTDPQQALGSSLPLHTNFSIVVAESHHGQLCALALWQHQFPVTLSISTRAIKPYRLMAEKLTLFCSCLLFYPHSCRVVLYSTLSSLILNNPSSRMHLPMKQTSFLLLYNPLFSFSNLFLWFSLLRSILTMPLPLWCSSLFFGCALAKLSFYLSVWQSTFNLNHQSKSIGITIDYIL